MKRKLVGLLFLIATVGILLAAFWATNLFGWRKWRIQEVQSFIGADLPAQSQAVQFATESQFGRIVWLRFELPAGVDLAPFLASLALTEPLRDGWTPFPAPNPQEAGLPWWTSHQAANFAGTYENTGQKIIELLADRSDPTRQLIYLRAYTIAAR
ncbi:MAG: hypothetical protein JNM70_11185 [Anaerolineae bacterium]|nr:hypothetical protein [Anaerolineae bacterium]